MIDKISLTRIQTLHPIVRSEATKAFIEASEALTGNAILRYAQTIRTWEVQNEIYAQGRTKLFDANGRRLGIVTYAKGGDSWHNYGLAKDIVLLIDKDGNGTYEAASWDIKTDFDKDGKSDWMEVSAIFEKYGWKYLTNKKGERWDYPHFQKVFGLTIAEAKKRYLAKDFIPGTSYIRI